MEEEVGGDPFWKTWRWKPSNLQCSLGRQLLGDVPLKKVHLELMKELSEEAEG